MATNAERDLQGINKEIARLKQEILELNKQLASGVGDTSKVSDALVQNNRLLMEQLSLKQKLVEAERNLRNASTGRSGSTSRTGGPIPHPAGRDITRPLDPDPISNFINQKAAADRELLGATRAGVNQTRASTKAEERRRKALEEAARLEESRNLVKNNPRYRQALEQAARIGLGAENLSKIEDRGGGVQQLLFRGRQGGVDNNFRTYVDQTGRSTPGLSSQFRSFGSDILRDIGQFTKWSIAVAAVYTPLQKLGELMKVMVENQSRLTDATVAANIPFERSGEIFEEVAVAANRAGEDITGVIDAYAQAFRAAGRYTDELERQQQTTALLNSSLTLSKLSVLDQSTAIDTLTAALLQTELELDQGEQLLNKWVRVSQVASVDIATLATGVAVLGDSAETAGLDIDKLNGLIAVLGEQSISGSKEAANTAKALIGAYQSDKSEAVLTKFGFALRTASGEARNFLDIYRELSKARQEGILSEANISEIALALGGGGVRRAKDASALINSYDRLNDIARESSEISSDSTLAQDSLAKTLQTVETANTRLANSFEQLAQTLGDDGGLLQTFTDILNILTAVTSGFNSLFELLGRSGPILTTTLAGLFALSRISPGRIQTIIAGLGGQFFAGGQFLPGGGRAPAGGAYTGFGGGIRGFGRRTAADILSLNTRGAGILGGLAVGASAISNIRQGEGDRAAGNVVGGVIGGAIGTYLGGPAGLAIGATIGSSIGDAFVSNVLEYEPAFENFFRDFIEQPGEGPREGESETDARRRLLAEEALRESGYSNLELVFDEFLVKTDDVLGDFLGDWARLFPDIDRDAFSAEALIGSNISPELRARIEREQQINRFQSGDYLPNEDPALAQRNAVLRSQLQEMALRERQNQLERLSVGEITPSEFGNIADRLTGFPTSTLRNLEAYGDEFINLSKEISNAQEAQEAFLYISTYGNQEQLKLLSQYTTDILTLENILSDFDEAVIGTKLELSFGETQIENEQQLAQLLQGIITEAGTAASSVYAQVQLSQLNLPNIVGSTTEATSQEDVNLIRQEAQKLQEQFYTDMDLSADAIEYLTENLEDFAVLVGDAAQNHFDTISGIDQKFWDAARKLLEEQQKIATDRGIGFQEFDVDRPTLDALAQQSLAIGQSWESRFNYDFRPEDQIALTTDGIVDPLHADFRILALLLEKIVDQNQKQLDGQYNIPEGATFWVPLTAAYYRNKGNDGALDSLGGINTQSLDTSANNLDQSANALDLSADAIMAAVERDDAMTRELLAELRTPKERLQERQVDRFRGVEAGEIGNTPGTRPRARFDDEIALPEEKGIFEGKYGNDYTPLFEGIKNFFNQLFQIPGITTGTGGLSSQMSSQNVAPQQTAKLDLKMESTTNLVVDGRVLATIMKPFFASDLIRTEASQGTITKRYII